MSIAEKDNTNLQTSFDLLGEIVKFNKRTLRLFECSVSEVEHILICDKIITNIIDSNVLVRALVLSLRRFATVRANYKPRVG